MPEDSRALLYRILSTDQQKQLEVNRQLDFSYGVPGLGRFRVNVHFQRDSLAAAFRHIPEELRTLEELGLPSSLRDLAMQPRGLVLVTGPTGSGKSTTLASMVDEVNRTKPHHILTIEDPIEFVHRHKRCVVTQREIGTDAPTFAEALRAALRQDPDVILLGEMRDLETIATALTAAETGHLVLATLHTQSAPSTIDRIIDVFPSAQQEQVRMQLANTLQGIVTQTLLPTADGLGEGGLPRDPLPRRRGPEHDPPGEGRADLLRHADLDAARHADDGARPRRAHPQARRHAGSGARHIEPEGSARRNARAERRPVARCGRRGSCVDLRTAPRRERLMDELHRDGSRGRHGARGTISLEDEETNVSVEADVIDRLAAYSHEVEYEPTPESAPNAESQVKPSHRRRHSGASRPRTTLPSRCRSRICTSPAPALVSEPRRFGRRSRSRLEARKATQGEAAKKLVGLKIGASQIAAAQVVNNGSPELVQVFREPLEPGVVVVGEIRDPEALGEALKRFFELHKLPKRGVRLGLSNNRIGVRVFEIDEVADAQLENAIRFRAEEVLPIPLDQAVLDYVVLGDDVASRRHGVEAHSPRRRVSGGRRPVSAGVSPRRSAGRRYRPRGVRAASLARAADRTRRERGRARGYYDRSRPNDDCGLERSLLRIRARARLGRLVAQRGDRPRARSRAE